MNKQWLKARIEAYLEYEKTLTASDYARGKQGGYRTALRLIKKLDEPQKPVVPKFVAEWYEKNKNDLHDKLFCEIATAGNVNEETTEFQHWLFNTPNCMNIVLNMKNGYKVEKEPLYEVVFLEKDGDRKILIEQGGLYDIEWESDNEGYWRTSFTEQEIKAANKNYWSFAVPVEEVAEG